VGKIVSYGRTIKCTDDPPRTLMYSNGRVFHEQILVS
jgi:hypothetical protein